MPSENGTPTTIELDSRTTMYDGFCRVDKLMLRHSLYVGGMSETLDREITHRGEAAAVLPYDAGRDAVVLIEQFRPGPYVAGWKNPWMVEIVAGTLEPGETPEELARREAVEEAGCILTDLIPIIHYMPSPGTSSESVHLYCGRVDAAGVGGLHGLDYEGEDIRARVVPVEEAFEMIRSGAIANAASIIALQWLLLHHADVRAGWA